MNLRLITIFLVVIAIFLPIFLLARAQGVDLLVTWRADSYVEPDYSGKILPAPGGSVRAGLQLIENNKPVIISQNEIAWFLDGRLLNRGLGLNLINFKVNPLSSGGSHKLKVVVFNYKGADISRIIDIPIARPEVVIRSPYTKNEIIPGKNRFSIGFFNWNIRNLNDLIINWRVAGELQQNAGGPAIELDIPAVFSGRSVVLSVSASNSANEYEAANNSVELLIK